MFEDENHLWVGKLKLKSEKNKKLQMVVLGIASAVHSVRSGKTQKNKSRVGTLFI
jgi:hypothetical protein